MASRRSNKSPGIWFQAQVWGSIIAAAFLLTSLFKKGLTLSALVIFLTLVAVFVIVGLLFLRWHRQSMQTRLQKLAERDLALSAMNIETAKMEAERLLAAPGQFSCIYAKSELANSFQLAEELSAFFSRYARVALEHGDAVIDRELISRSGINGKFVRIGTDLDGCDFAVLNGKETIFEVDDGPQKEFRQYPSIYHLLLSLSKERGPIKADGAT